MTQLEKRFMDIFKEKHPDMDDKTILVLMRNNLIDFKTMKIAIVRHSVEDCVKRGCGKREAMRLVADDLATSYKYVEKVMYYNKDINI